MSKYIIPTYTGKLFDLLEPTEDMICIEDIAHHLSIENRFNGATKFPYSVAYHSILVSQKLPENLKLEGLLHDAEEAYYKDLTRPLKHLIGLDKYEGIIEAFMGLLWKKFYLLLDSRIKIVDYNMCATEIKQLIKYFPEESWTPVRMGNIYDDIEILNLSARNVEELFLKEYEKWRRV